MKFLLATFLVGLYAPPMLDITPVVQFHHIDKIPKNSFIRGLNSINSKRIYLLAIRQCLFLREDIICGIIRTRYYRNRTIVTYKLKYYGRF